MSHSPPSSPAPTAADWTGYAPLDAGGAERMRAAMADLRGGLRRFPSWRYLAVEAVKNQYRRTVLGPWWLTLQTTIYVLGLALIFGQLLGAGLESFLPFVAVGFITFALLQGLTRAGAQVFVNAANTMKSTRQPLSSLVLRDVTIELIQFGHNLVVVAALVAFGLITPSLSMLFAVPIAAIIAFNGLFIGLWLGPTVARFRDVGPAVLSILQVLIFFTPVFYRAEDLTGTQAAIVSYNPFTPLIEAFRDSVIGGLEARTFLGVAAVTVVNVLLGTLVFSRTRSRLPYWVA